MPWVRMLMFFSLAIGATGGLHVYLGQRLFLDSGAPTWVQLWGFVLLGLGFLSMPVGFAVLRLGSRRISSAAGWLAFGWMGLYSLLLVAVAGTDLIRLLLTFGKPLSSAQREQVGAIQAMAALATVIPASVAGFSIARGRARVNRLQVPIARLGPGMDGLKIVQLSDIHIGPTLGKRYLERLVQEANALAPDITVITGDLVDGTVEQLRADVAPLMGLRAPLGVYFVTGNHEYYSGADAWEAEVARLGITVLHNAHRVLTRGGDRLVLAGITDFEGGRFSKAHAPQPDAAFAGAPDGIPRILLAHQPRSAKAASPHQVDLQLSGHTHAGQFFPWMFFVRLQQPVVKGLRTLHGVRVFTHQGTGYWGPPLRLGTSPEIAEITLTAESRV